MATLGGLVMRVVLAWLEVGFRASGGVDRIDDQLTTPREMSLDPLIEYLKHDELLEVTPESVRILDTLRRWLGDKRAKEALGASAYLAYSFSPSEFAGSQCGKDDQASQVEEDVSKIGSKEQPNEH